MKNNITLWIAIMGISVLPLSAATAQQAPDESADVWEVVEEQWDAEENGDRRWIQRMLVDKFMGWSKNSPAPRNKSSTDNWDKFTDEQGKLVFHELYPLSIVVHDNVAIAHYLYSSAYEDSEGEVEISNGRYTDVLVKTDDGWRFIAWHGGDD